MNKPETFKAVTIVGSLVNLSGLDFSNVNICCYNLNDPQLKSVSNTFKPMFDAYYALHNILEEDAKKFIHNYTQIHVLLPLDFSKPVNKNDYIRCIDLIKVLFPSDLQLNTVAEFKLNENKETEWIISESYSAYSTDDGSISNFLAFPVQQKVGEVNEFIKTYLERIESLKYVQIAIDAYVNSFSSMPIHMSFISLCIALETIVDSKSELNYRIRRTSALLCAGDIFHGKIIYDNVNRIYTLRSKIVHGDFVKLQIVNDYIPYLRNLISVTIVRLIQLNYESPKKLEDAMTFMSFEEMNKISPIEKKLINLISYSETYKKLQ